MQQILVPVVATLVHVRTQSLVVVSFVGIVSGILVQVEISTCSARTSFDTHDGQATLQTWSTSTHHVVDYMYDIYL